MAVATIKLVDRNHLGDFYFRQNVEALARRLMEDGKYFYAGEFVLDMPAEDACEELFDLTNNPMRQEERVRRYGRDRSLSVGDVVEVDGVDYLCKSVGWEVI